MTLGRKLILALVVGLLLGMLVAAAGGGDDDGGSYRVRAVFDNGSFVIPGEDVKVAGVKVGQIDDVDLTDENKAAIVLRIDDKAFTPFRRDAHCQLRLQSLIGEQYVECEPTRPRKEGQQLPPALKRIDSGRGEGQYLLSVDHTTTPVAVDLINNIARLPQQQRFRLIINELGAGLAGNGPALREAVRRANPALRELDERDRDPRRAGPAARAAGRRVGRGARALGASSASGLPASSTRRAPPRRRPPSAATTSSAASSACRASCASCQGLPIASARLPTSSRRRSPSCSATPRRSTPRSRGSDRSRPPPPRRSRASATFAQRGRSVFPAIRPLVRDVQQLSRPLKPTAGRAADLLGSVDRTGGVEELMRLLFYYSGSINGEDELGHYVRVALRIGCAQRSGLPVPGCESTFERIKKNEAPAQAAAQDAMLDYLLAPQEGGQ